MKLHALLLVVLALPVAAPGDDEPWIVTGDVVITEPTTLGHTIVVGEGSITVRDVPDPGVQVEGHLWMIESSELVLERSAIRFLSTYNGQYQLVAVDEAEVQIRDCDYRVPHGVQHGLVTAGDATMTVEDSTFGFAQLVAAERSSMTARRLDGEFEVIVQEAAGMILEDIPHTPGAGHAFVWVEFGPGSEAVYSPPLPGFVDAWTFPPDGSVGIPQTVRLDRVEVLLWPMLVEPSSRLVLRDIPAESWTVVGLHLPNDAHIRGLVNGGPPRTGSLALADRSIELDDASVDSWNLYPQADARIAVTDCVLGEIVSLERSRTHVSRSVIDGSGGFLGSRDSSHLVAHDTTVTCTVEAAQESVLELHRSRVLPYPQDPNGEITRLGAYDSARLLVDHTPVETIPALGGDGLLAAVYLANPPAVPPTSPLDLHGSVIQVTLADPDGAGSWRIDALPTAGGWAEPVGAGTLAVDNGLVGTWTADLARADYRLRIQLTDDMGRRFTSWVAVPDPPTAAAPR